MQNPTLQKHRTQDKGRKRVKLLKLIRVHKIGAIIPIKPLLLGCYALACICGEITGFALSTFHENAYYYTKFNIIPSLFSIL